MSLETPHCQPAQAEIVLTVRGFRIKVCGFSSEVHVTYGSSSEVKIALKHPVGPVHLSNQALLLKRQSALKWKHQLSDTLTAAVFRENVRIWQVLFLGHFLDFPNSLNSGIYFQRSLSYIQIVYRTLVNILLLCTS
jgi:hypothetical protein